MLLLLLLSTVADSQEQLEQLEQLEQVEHLDNPFFVPKNLRSARNMKLVLPLYRHSQSDTLQLSASDLGGHLDNVVLLLLSWWL